MISSYFWSSIKRNPGKTTLLILSVAIYFFLISLMITAGRNMDAIASLPFKAIGVDAVVQKMGQIPNQMSGLVYPHANAPIYPGEVSKLKSLEFVERADTGLYFWYFDNSYYKDVFGVQPDDTLFSGILRDNIKTGDYLLDKNEVLVTEDFAQKNSLVLGDGINIAQNNFTVSGVLRSNLTGNIVPAGIYMDYDSAMSIAKQSDQMKEIYGTGDRSFVNVVLLKIKPQWRGDIQKSITGIDNDFLVFSEQTFSAKLMDQIKLLSSFGQTVFLILGILLLIVYVFLVFYNLKMRDREIGILRMLGWSVKKIRKQFLSEGIILVVFALLLGNALAFLGTYAISHVKLTMEIPWEISAKPHFLPQENNIDRAVTGAIPVSYNLPVSLLISFSFILTLTLVNYLLFRQIKNFKPEVKG